MSPCCQTSSRIFPPLLRLYPSTPSNTSLDTAVIRHDETTKPLITPPGQERPYPKPTKTGRIPFTIPSTGDKGETYHELWGDLACGRTPLICLHGGPGAPGTYLRPLSLVQVDHGIPVLTYHQIGCGESTRFPQRAGDTAFWTPELFMAELDNLLAALRIAAFDLLGQSWGGMLAAQYALGQPRGLRKLVISNSPASMATWVAVTARLRAALPADVIETLDRCEREGREDSEEYQEAVMVFYRRHVCRTVPLAPEFVEAIEYLKEDSTVYGTMNGPSEFNVVGSLKSWSIEDQLHKITPQTAPGGMLLMNGYFDEAQDEVMQPFFTLPTVKTKWVRFALSSHIIQVEEMERVVRDLGMFLAS